MKGNYANVSSTFNVNRCGISTENIGASLKLSLLNYRAYYIGARMVDQHSIPVPEEFLVVPNMYMYVLYFLLVFLVICF